MASGIQFFGRERVVAAYAARGIDCWAVCEGRDLNMTGCDGDELGKFLEMLDQDGSAATYTLRFYRDIEDPDTITPKTECSSSFKFKLTQAGGMSGMAVSRYGGVDPITAKVQSVIADEVGKVIDRKLGKGGGDDDGPEEETLSSVIMGLVKQPDKLIGVLQGIRGLFAPADTMVHPSAVPYAAVSGAAPRRMGVAGQPTMQAVADKPAGPTVRPDKDSEEAMDRLYSAYIRLEHNDPDILINLEKLAMLSEKKPDFYKMAIAQLNAL